MRLVGCLAIIASAALAGCTSTSGVTVRTRRAVGGREAGDRRPSCSTSASVFDPLAPAGEVDKRESSRS
jgi:hypothetical protein